MVEFRRVSSPQDIATCLEIRRVVFIEGQNVPEDEEVDGRDAECRHYLGLKGTRPIATARVLPLDTKAKIQRVAVLQEFQGTGIGAQLMRYLLDDIRNEFKTAKLGSQTHAIGFYETLGFTAFGPEFDDAGIPHREMSLTF